MIAQAQTFGLIDELAIILSIVSLIITIVGFFASLKFYRDGVGLQKAANDALTKLEERTQFIQSQVGGMFDKTLDAAIGKGEALSDRFEEINDQLEKAKVKLIEESISQIGSAGEQERKRIAKLVDGQMALIREKVETTRESAEEMVQPTPLAAIDRRLAILTLVAKSEGGATQQEILPHLPISVASLYRVITDLEKSGLIETKDGRFSITPSGKKSLVQPKV